MELRVLQKKHINAYNGVLINMDYNKDNIEEIVKKVLEGMRGTSEPASAAPTSAKSASSGKIP